MSGNPHVDVMLAGAAAAFTVDLLIYPLDTLKTRQQSRDYLKTFADPTSSSSSSSSSSSTGTKRLLPPRHLFRGLYQGIGIVIVATLPASGTFFLSYEAAKRIIGDRGRSLGLPQPAVHSAASALAECASCLVLTPAEVIKQNAQMMMKNKKKQSSSSQSPGTKATTKTTTAPSSSTSLAALRQLSHGRGVTRNLLSGYTALVARNLPFTALQFPIFEYVRETIWEGRRAKGAGGKSRASLWETGVVTGISAGLAGSFSAVVTTPMDVVKTRMMLSAGENSGVEGQGGKPHKSGSSSASAPSKHRSNMGGLAVTRQVIADKGIAGLFRGALLRGVWTAVGSGLYLGMYEVSKVWLTRDEKDLEDRGFP